jgi:Squalene-hopene cyclase N-terminal domain
LENLRKTSKSTVRMMLQTTPKIDIYYLYAISIKVSYPGGPIAKPLTRIAKWKKRSSSLTSMWTFASDSESHEISNKEYPDTELSGPSAGRQIWYHKDGSQVTPSFSADTNPNSSDILLRAQMIAKWNGKIPDEKVSTSSAREASIKALSFYQMLQCDDGHWAGDYGGPMFLMPGLITALYITKAPFSAGKKSAMIAYLKNHQQDDGGWGTHIECASTMFGSVLSYVSLRLLGEKPDLPYMLEARQFISSHGGALYSPSWCKVSGNRTLRML